jgi:hypothetical protein
MTNKTIWTVETLVEAMRATGKPAGTAPFDALFGEGTPARSVARGAFCGTIATGASYVINGGCADASEASEAQLSAVCDALNELGVPPPPPPPIDSAKPKRWTLGEVADAFVPPAAVAPKVDPYEAHDIVLLDRAGEVALPPGPGGEGRTDRRFAFSGAHYDREGARVGAAYRLEEARKKAAEHRREADLCARAAASLERALAENGKAGGK